MPKEHSVQNKANNLSIGAEHWMTDAIEFILLFCLFIDKLMPCSWEERFSDIFLNPDLEFIELHILTSEGPRRSKVIN